MDAEFSTWWEVPADVSGEVTIGLVLVGTDVDAPTGTEDTWEVVAVSVAATVTDCCGVDVVVATVVNGAVVASVEAVGGAGILTVFSTVVAGVEGAGASERAATAGIVTSALSLRFDEVAAAVLSSVVGAALGLNVRASVATFT